LPEQTGGIAENVAAGAGETRENGTRSEKAAADSKPDKARH